MNGEINWTAVGIIVNAALVVTSGLLGFLVRGMTKQIGDFKEAIKSLQVDDATMAGKIGSVELLVAGQYVRRDEFTTVLNKEVSELRGQFLREIARVELQVTALRSG